MKRKIVAILLFLLLIFLPILSNSWDGRWTERKPTPKQGGYGECVIGLEDAIYVIRAASKGNSSYLWKYEARNDTWGTLKIWSGIESGLPRPKNGVAMAWAHNCSIYIMFGASYKDYGRRYFYRYNIKNNTWKRLADTPFDQGAGDAMTYCGYDGNIYCIMGNKNKGSIFAYYSIKNNTWKELPFIWSSTDDGCSLAWTGGKYIYALRGEYEESIPNGEFSRYNIQNKTWENLPDLPSSKGIGDGASLLWLGNFLSNYKNCMFALSGGGADESPGYDFYIYSIPDGSWKSLPSLPYPIGYYVGNRLAYANQSIYYWQGAPSTWDGGGRKFCQFILHSLPFFINFKSKIHAGFINITCNTCYNVSAMFINITLPDGSYVNESMKCLGDTYYFNDSFSLEGTYSFYIYAVDENIHRSDAMQFNVYPSWDINMDSHVNILDLIMVAMHFGEEEYAKEVDLNNDGTINVLDLILVAMHWTG